MDFWKEFMKIEQRVVYNLRLGSPEGQACALKGIEIAGKISGYPLMFQIGVDMRNGKKFPERENKLELIVSPNWDRKKVKLVNEVYDAWKKSDFPSYWSVVKYQVFNPSIVHDLKVHDATHEDFEYCTQFNFEGNDAWVGVLIFVSDRLADEILKKNPDDNSDEKNQWVLNGTPKSRSPLIFLNSAVGEFNMITRIKAVEFLPASSYKTIPRYSLTDLHKEFEKMNRQSYGDLGKIHECVRCGYFSYQVDLEPCQSCKKIYYCDDICRKADAENHAFICSP